MTEELSVLIALSQSGDRRACEKLISDNMGLVKSIAYRFTGRGTDFEDLCQIGLIGMLKAIKNFDYSKGFAFSTYAVPLITGEIKRYLRDDGLIKVGRETKKRRALLLKARENFIAGNCREPSLRELAEICKMSVEDTVMSLDSGSPVISFSEPCGERMFEDTVGVDSLREVCDDIALTQALQSLDETERKLILCRYFRNMPQARVGELLGMSQVKVSRTEKKIIAKLKSALL